MTVDTAKVDVEDGVATFFEKLARAWGDNDGTRFAGYFADEGSLINPFGKRADGRAALASMYGDYFAGMLRGTTTTIALTHVRPVGSDHAFADADQTIHGEDGEVLMALHLVNLLRRQGEEWRLVDSRPYAFQTAPA
jgi:uncharacterized protein (TIGR02246 family)